MGMRLGFLYTNVEVSLCFHRQIVLEMSEELAWKARKPPASVWQGYGAMSMYLSEWGKACDFLCGLVAHI